MDSKRWLVPLVCGTILCAALFLLFIGFVRLPQPAEQPAAVARERPPAVTLTSAVEENPVRRELLDLEPLFLPTQDNTSVLELPEHARREPGSMSFSFPAKLVISESAGGLALPEPIAVPSTPVAVLNLGQPPNPFPEVGVADVELPAFPKRLAFVEVRRAEDGQIAYADAIPPPPEPVLPNAEWAPVEYLIAVDAAGLVGSPAVTRRTTADEIEDFFRDFLARRLQLGAKLAPGFYTVHVGP